MLWRIASAAALAGVLSGVLLTAIQQFQIAPLIRTAEVYERAAIDASGLAHGHLPIVPEPPAWSPGTSGQRLLATAASNIVLATGFALMLVAAISRKGTTGWRAGMGWGAAGYAVFFVAPSLGLPPELPGTLAAPLRDRELWWVATVVLSTAGLWLIVFPRKAALRILGVMLLVAPHVIGAPKPATHDDTMPARLAEEFLGATYFANAAFWLVMGALSGLFYRPGK
jgi:cobalt transporter subunit CbtA